ncbi:spore coat protein [Desulfoscipio gibsoniae]|uniref:Coat F domain-containing protein n=1 Tax=Desulfoscipio gibsoniae DSM 7213 TaxID=767817 RepID=R4KJ83_9FIRM|nr:spore coat protein [Desulfoscipio gibsoniae]AGL03278.1 coat F domain-containing protein [Desulfoscipio gibsoniae DSM 7213]
MKTGTRQAMVISEVLRSNASMIDHYNLYMNSCQDQQLRSILDRQQRHTLDSFQRLTQMMQSHGLDISNIPMPTTMSMTGTGAMATATTTSAPAPYGTQWTAPQYSTGQTGTVPYTMQHSIGSQGISMSTPTRTEAPLGVPMGMQTGMQTGAQAASNTGFNDHAIAEGALQFHKCGADINTRAALESSEPHIRTALTNMARNCIEMSYEIYTYMSQRGWYQLPNTPQNFISHSPTQQQQQQYTHQ